LEKRVTRGQRLNPLPSKEKDRNLIIKTTLRGVCIAVLSAEKELIQIKLMLKFNTSRLFIIPAVLCARQFSKKSRKNILRI